jgi:hypothetical protein
VTTGAEWVYWALGHTERCPLDPQIENRVNRIRLAPNKLFEGELSYSEERLP